MQSTPGRDQMALPLGFRSSYLSREGVVIRTHASRRCRSVGIASLSSSRRKYLYQLGGSRSKTDGCAIAVVRIVATGASRRGEWHLVLRHELWYRHLLAIRKSDGALALHQLLEGS